MSEQEVVDEQKEVVVRVMAVNIWTAEGALWSTLEHKAMFFCNSFNLVPEQTKQTMTST